jgi:hypothetical protein
MEVEEKGKFSQQNSSEKLIPSTKNTKNIYI